MNIKKQNTSTLGNENNTVIIKKLLYKIRGAIKNISILLIFSFSYSCSITDTETKQEHGLEKSPCACGDIYNSKERA